jgi:hypothetical protein
VAERIKIIMNPQDSTTTTPPSAIQSEISELSKNVQSLTSRVNLANNLYIGFLAATLLATILIVKWNGKLNSAKDDLERAKDRKVAGELSEKDAQLEAEKSKRLELEKTLAPRQIPLKIVLDEQTNLDTLKPFKGINAIILTSRDVESGRAAANIGSLIDAAGWHVVTIESNSALNNWFFDGVVVEPYSATQLGEAARKLSDEEFKDEEQANGATKVLVEFLKSNDWQARSYLKPLSQLGPIPHKTIRISVGFKPAPYFDQTLKQIKEVEERFKKRDEERQKREQDFRDRLQQENKP